MKKFTLLSATLLAVGLMFTSCKKEQSELTMETVKGKAYITGKVEYNEGFAKESGVIVTDHMAPAAGQIVMVQVNTSDYAEGAVGKQTFTTNTDEKGHYTIEIPVSVKGVEATVSVVPFRATKYFSDDADNPVPKEGVLFNICKPQTRTLTEESYQTCDLRVESKEELDVTYTKVTTVTGKISTRVWKKDDEDTWFANENTNSGVSKVDLEAKISITDREENTTELIIRTTTNDEGEYSFDLTLPTGYKNSDVYMVITSTPFVREFTHHYYETENDAWKAQTVNVIYGSVSDEGRSLSSSDYIAPIQYGEKIIRTKPVNRSEVKGINPGDEENGIKYYNPLGW